ncbi:hypothetical protein EBF16_18070 [Sphingobium yanoikuyae]|uniref:Uncharacterized protein n=1 Tax=Sphingobium yanoikuyae TaxID=13690 RepID=A0A3G2UUC0_SPHYA|nr:hypothetical protein EBF16_18070 [Sphingobium yanoikuyae]
MTVRRAALVVIPVWFGLMLFVLFGFVALGLPTEIGWPAITKRLAMGGAIAYFGATLAVLRFSDSLARIKTLKRR